MHGNLALANGLLFASAAGRTFVVEVSSGRVLRILTPAATGPAYTGPVVANGLLHWLAGPVLNAWGVS
jgi:hypothetical protein